ncbi:MAG: MFS transporter [Chloroflexi bacterium]|nr:MFS transporter [Chloroflexota bacterium]
MIAVPFGLFALWALLFVALGLSLAVLGPSLPELRAELDVSIAASGLLFTLHSAGYLGGVFAAGPLADRRGRKLVSALGVVGLAAGMGLAAAVPSWAALLATMVLAGTGFAFLDVGLNAAIGDAVLGARRRAAAMNLLHGAFPLGTLVAPAGVAVALHLGWGWRAAFLGTGLAAAISLAGFLLSPRRWPVALLERDRYRRGRSSSSPLHVLQLLREPYLRTLATIQALYVGVEVGLAGWVATYVIEQFGAGETAGALATSAYWAGFLAGRPIVAVLTNRFTPNAVLPWFSALGIATAVASVLAPGPFSAAVAFALTGVAICGVFPTVMALALEERHGDAGAATALITAAAALGGLTWPWFVGVVAQSAGPRAAMLAATAPLVVMLALSQGSLKR